jgi:hypothetical protein
MWKSHGQFAVIRIKLRAYETGFASRFREWLRRSDEGRNKIQADWRKCRVVKVASFRGTKMSGRADTRDA